MLEITEHTRIRLGSDGLSPREIEILTLLAQGKSNRAIGNSLGISPRTVSKHLEHIYPKLNVQCRTSALATLIDISQTTASSKKALVKTQEVKTHRKRILLVDDDQRVRMVLRALLEYQGYICEEAENGAEALEWFDTQQADLIISDCHMPGISGLSFIKQLKSRFHETKTSLLPIIVLSGHLTKTKKERLSQIGVYAIFEKPPQFDSLLSTVAQFLMDRASRQ